MYWITVDIEYMDNTKSYHRFETWDDAGVWISNFDKPGKMPKEIIMGIVWS